MFRPVGVYAEIIHIKHPYVSAVDSRKKNKIKRKNRWTLSFLFAVYFYVPSYEQKNMLSFQVIW